MDVVNFCNCGDKRKREYPRDEWEKQKPLIKSLYLDEQKTQRQVEMELDKHCFHVNKRMLQGHIQGWGFHQKNKKRSRTGYTNAVTLSAHPSVPWSCDDLIYGRALWAIRTFCLGYMSPSNQLQNSRPTYHRETSHAVFAERIKDGISLLSLQPSRANIVLDEAMNELGQVIRSLHPTAIAKILTILCLLQAEDGTDREKRQAVQTVVLKHSHQLARVVLDSSHPLIVFFDSLHQAGRLRTDVLLRSLRNAKDTVLESAGRYNWRTIGMEGELGDALHYSGEDEESFRVVSSLLSDQLEAYQVYKRSALWTLKNIADLQLRQGRIADSESKYRSVLTESNAYIDFDKAMLSTAALQGLARVELAKVQSRECEVFQPAALTRLTKARDLLASAVLEAEMFFPEYSHRTEKLRRELTDVSSRITNHNLGSATVT